MALVHRHRAPGPSCRPADGKGRGSEAEGGDYGARTAASERGGWSREGQSSEARRAAGGSGALTPRPGRRGVSDGWVAPSARTWSLGPCVLEPRGGRAAQGGNSN